MKIEQLIKNLIKQGESAQLEFVETSNKEHIVNTICGFLNGNGGQILVGVKNNGTISGILNSNNYKLQMLFKKINQPIALVLLTCGII